MNQFARPGIHAVGDTVDAAYAVAVVSVALGRLTVETAFRASRMAAATMAAPSPARSLPRVLRPALGWGWRATAGAREVALRRVNALADVLLPRTVAAVLAKLDVAGLVLRYVDLNRIAGGLDVDEVAARLDVARVIDRVDIDAIAAGLDLNALVEKVDIARVIDRVDLDDIVGRVDIARVIDRVDLDEIVGRVDIARVIDRVDLDEIVGRVDVDRIAARLDLDPVIARADIAGIARYVIAEIDLPEVIRMSTGSLTTEMVRGVRDQGVDADRAVERVVDRLLLRRHGRHDDEPGHRP